MEEPAMSEDSFTEVSQQSWLGRIGDAFKGIIVGLILFVVAFPLLFWNEGRAVKRYKTLKEGGGVVVSVDADTVDRQNTGKLVHVMGMTDTGSILKDPVFDVSLKAIKLKRSVEMYQWVESVKSETQKKLGGSTETVKTYSYKKEWSAQPISSDNFKKPDGHQNPGVFSYQSSEQVSQQVNLGAFKLPASLVQKIDNYTPLPLTAMKNLPESLKEKATISESEVYIGKDRAAPRIGDVRISFAAVNPAQISVIAQQIGNSFEPYRSKVGGTIELLQIGSHSADNMIQKAQEENTILTWILRVVGFIVMGFGLSMIFKPLSVFADVLPILGNILGAGAGIISFLVAGVLSLITVAIAWIVYRPLIAIILIAVAGGLGFLVWSKLKKSKAATAVAVG